MSVKARHRKRRSGWGRRLSQALETHLVLRSFNKALAASELGSTLSGSPPNSLHFSAPQPRQLEYNAAPLILLRQREIRPSKEVSCDAPRHAPALSVQGGGEFHEASNFKKASTAKAREVASSLRFVSEQGAEAEAASATTLSFSADAPKLPASPCESSSCGDSKGLEVGETLCDVRRLHLCQ